ncbi:MAG: PhoD-like phosphatase N-terminal domain-containing protein [Candidatus Marinimicrobia bacterium]|nr:PhoD-like phosphatase N-terminal domain-containing protein [Candidatus Neomarinimicrobiota bacterium]
MAGEVTQTSVILQSRLTHGDKLIDGDLPGHPGIVCFEISESESFEKSFKTDWVMATSENDFIIKIKVTGLNPGTRYYYRLLYGENSKSYRKGRTCGFRTWPEPNVEE